MVLGLTLTLTLSLTLSLTLAYRLGEARWRGAWVLCGRPRGKVEREQRGVHWRAEDLQVAAERAEGDRGRVRLETVEDQGACS